MSTPTVEVEPDFFLRVSWKGPLSASQMAALRRLGPGLSEAPVQSLLGSWRQTQEITLGPYYRKYQAECAKSELRDTGLDVEIFA